MQIKMSDLVLRKALVTQVAMKGKVDDEETRSSRTLEFVWRGRWFGWRRNKSSELRKLVTVFRYVLPPWQDAVSLVVASLVKWFA